MKKVIIIGGGASGFFAAANINSKEAEVIILERSSKLLSKVRISGGGRCNVTHACFDNNVLVEKYPRGERELKGAFSRFTTTDTIEWFENRGVGTHVESDGRMFPKSNDSFSIINCLQNEVDRLGVKIQLNCQVIQILKKENGFIVKLKSGEELTADKVIVAMGGNAKPEAYSFIKELGISMIEPVPSLFTFNIPRSPITELMGVSVPQARVRIQGTKLEEEGPLLITHWGLSGPVVLRLSAWGARLLNKMNYQFFVNVSWLSNIGYEDLRIVLDKFTAESKKQVQTHSIAELPQRLWTFLLEKAEIPLDLRWADVSKKQKARLIEILLNDTYEVRGKTTFKEEFVTSGGIELNEVDFKSMESRKCPGLYFVGEVLNVDGITGGFNFQNAWTTAWIAAQHISKG